MNEQTKLTLERVCHIFDFFSSHRGGGEGIFICSQSEIISLDPLNPLKHLEHNIVYQQISGEVISDDNNGHFVVSVFL